MEERKIWFLSVGNTIRTDKHNNEYIEFEEYAAIKNIQSFFYNEQKSSLLYDFCLWKKTA